MLNGDVECFSSKHQGASGGRGALAVAPRGPGATHGDAGPRQLQAAAWRPCRPRATAREGDVDAGDNVEAWPAARGTTAARRPWPDRQHKARRQLTGKEKAGEGEDVTGGRKAASTGTPVMAQVAATDGAIRRGR